MNEQSKSDDDDFKGERPGTPSMSPWNNSLSRPTIGWNVSYLDHQHEMFDCAGIFAFFFQDNFIGYLCSFFVGGLVALVALCVACMLCVHIFSSKPETLIAQAFPDQPEVRFLFNFIANRDSKPSNTPTPYASIVIGKSAHQVQQFINTSTNLWSSSLSQRTTVKWIESGYSERAQMEHDVAKELDPVTSPTVVFIDGVNRLAGRAPLALQALTDENAPHNRAVFIFTLSEEEIGNVECGFALEEYLIDVWTSSELAKDQIRPIISRITSFCLKLEPSVRSASSEL